MNKTKSRNKTTLLSVALIIVSLIIIVATTLAYFTDRLSNNNTMQFGKISIVEGKGFVSGSTSLKDKLPGDKITDTISFSKAVDSQPMYVRAKVSFTTNGNDTVKAYVNGLNDGTFAIKEYTTGDYKWSERMGNYYYLMNKAGDTVHTLSTSEEIILADSLVLSTDLKQDEEKSQYMEEISLTVEIQAIQAQGLDSNMLYLDSKFDQIFGENAVQKKRKSFNVYLLKDNISDTSTVKEVLDQAQNFGWFNYGDANTISDFSFDGEKSFAIDEFQAEWGLTIIDSNGESTDVTNFNETVANGDTINLSYTTKYVVKSIGYIFESSRILSDIKLRVNIMDGSTIEYEINLLNYGANTLISVLCESEGMGYLTWGVSNSDRYHISCINDLKNANTSQGQISWFPCDVSGETYIPNTLNIDKIYYGDDIATLVFGLLNDNNQFIKIYQIISIKVHLTQPEIYYLRLNDGETSINGVELIKRAYQWGFISEYSMYEGSTSDIYGWLASLNGKEEKQDTNGNWQYWAQLTRTLSGNTTYNERTLGFHYYESGDTLVLKNMLSTPNNPEIGFNCISYIELRVI